MATHKIPGNSIIWNEGVEPGAPLSAKEAPKIVVTWNFSIEPTTLMLPTNLYIPSTINTDYMLWQLQLIVAVGLFWPLKVHF